MSENNEVNFAPPKSLFVKMLVRDIELKDAILDLLDNCIDGVQRDLKKKNATKNSETPYENYQASITLNPKEFIIEDNCGGIPRETAKNYAFRIGRVDENQDSDLETVGMYGIGMKRAIFKMGTACDVISQNDTQTYKVSITPEWLREEDNYILGLEDIDENLGENGTKIHIRNLYENIARKFDPQKSCFGDLLRKEISQLFSVIIRKGFTVTLNGKRIEPKEVTLLVPQELSEENSHAIEPFLFKGNINDVSIELAVGFYRGIASQEEIDQEQVEKKTSERAGWSIVCNDRLVLYADKTYLTGWGTAGIPNYHTQFIAIAGIVTLKSSHAENLPLTTTKRGLDTNSEVYSVVLDIMREGMRHFIDYTNKWKGRVDETSQSFQNLRPQKIKDISRFQNPEHTGWIAARRYANKATEAYKYEPKLPLPQDKKKYQRITFNKPSEDIDVLKEYFFEDMDYDSIKPSEIGEQCFNECLKKAKQ